MKPAPTRETLWTVVVVVVLLAATADWSARAALQPRRVGWAQTLHHDVVLGKIAG